MTHRDPLIDLIHEYEVAVHVAERMPMTSLRLSSGTASPGASAPTTGTRPGSIRSAAEPPRLKLATSTPSLVSLGVDYEPL